MYCTNLTNQEHLVIAGTFAPHFDWFSARGRMSSCIAPAGSLIPAPQARSIVELEVELEVVGINLRLAVKERDQVGIVRQTRIF